MSRVQLKDPGETEAYSFDWNDAAEDSLATGETISSSSWAVDHGDVTKSAEANTSTTTTVTLAGGSRGQICWLKNTVTTSQGRTMVRRLCVRIGTR